MGYRFFCLHNPSILSKYQRLRPEPTDPRSSMLRVSKRNFSLILKVGGLGWRFPSKLMDLAIRARVAKSLTEVSLFRNGTIDCARSYRDNDVAFPILNYCSNQHSKVDNKKKIYLQPRSVRLSWPIYGTLATNGFITTPERSTYGNRFLKPKSKTNAEPTSNETGKYYHRYQQMEILDIILP